MSKFVVVTGGPYSGKTTLVEALASQGFDTVPEAGISVIAELNDELGVEGQVRWRREHRAEFQVRVLARQLELEGAARARGAAVVFLDRGSLDGLAYCRHYGIAPPPELRGAAAEARYDCVVVLDTLAAAQVRSSTGRTSDRATSLALRDHLIAVYREHGYDPVLVPEMPLADRVRRARELAGVAAR